MPGNHLLCLSGCHSSCDLQVAGLAVRVIKQLVGAGGGYGSVCHYQVSS